MFIVKHAFEAINHKQRAHGKKNKMPPFHATFRSRHIGSVLWTKSELKEAFVVCSYLGTHSCPLWKGMLKYNNFKDIQL